MIGCYQLLDHKLITDYLISAAGLLWINIVVTSFRKNKKNEEISEFSDYDAVAAEGRIGKSLCCHRILNVLLIFQKRFCLFYFRKL